MADSSAFLDAFQTELDPFHRARLEAIDNFDYLPALRKVSHDLGGVTDRYLREGEFALKQYYAVALLDPRNEHAVASMVDPFWHAHVLHTKEYVKFCDAIFGGYIHHQPLDPDDAEEVKRVAKLYAYTVDTYRKIFKTVDSEWWPDVDPNGPGLASRVVCKHMLVHDEEITARALFAAR